MSRARDILRLQPVRDASVRTLEAIIDVLRQTVGRATSLVVLPLLVGPTTITATASPGTRLAGSAHRLELPDALLQQWRLCVEGSAASASIELRNLTLNIVMATVTLPTTTGMATGAWSVMPITAPLEHELEARVVGSGSVTLAHLTAQARTVVAPSR